MEYSFHLFYLCFVEKRDKIILSAMQLLIDNGVQATPMSAIAKEAGTGMGTIYNYFATKEDLINAIYLHIKEDEIKSLIQPFSDESIKRRFDHFYNAMVRYFINHPLHFRFMDQFHTSPIITPATKEAGARVIAPFIELLQKGQQLDIIKMITAEELLQFLNGGMMGFIRWILVSGKPLTDDLVNNQLRIAWDAIKQ